MGKWKTVANIVTYPLAHPQKTARTVFSVGKTAAVTGAVGYVGWEALTQDKSVARVVSETIIGEGATDAVAHTVTGISEMVDGTTEKIGQATAALGTASQGLNGISNFLGNLFGGSGGNMFGNFFSNLTSGKVSGLGIFGLVGAAMLIFGRTGWFGKIAGAMLAITLSDSRIHSRKLQRGCLTAVLRSIRQRMTPAKSLSRHGMVMAGNCPLQNLPRSITIC